MVGGLDDRHAFKAIWDMKPKKDAHDPPVCFIPVPSSLAGLCISYSMNEINETPIEYLMLLYRRASSLKRSL
jgi:hypothetical protein